jgi:tellurite resistance protein
MTTQPAHSAPRPRLPLGWFGVPLGITGLAGGWAAAQTDLGAPQWPAEILYGIATVLWAVLSVAYVATGLRSGREAKAFTTDRNHPLTGPFSAYIPLIAILLAAHYSSDAAMGGAHSAIAGADTLRWITAASVAALAIVAAQLVAHWLTGGIAFADVHPGYFVPVVAGANVASIGLSQIGQHGPAMGAFAVGLFFWLVIGTAAMIRLVSHGPLPEPLRPALSAFLAASATSSLAWIISHPGPLDDVQYGLTGILVLMLVVQGALLPVYARLRPGFSFWIFTFPVASTTNYAVRFFATTGLAGWRIWAWGILAIATAFVVLVTAVSLPRRRSTPEHVTGDGDAGAQDPAPA